jgi:hypothetical protein
MYTHGRNDVHVILCFVIFILLFPTFIISQTITFSDSNPDTMVISNGIAYEIGLSKLNGAISYIDDLKNGKRLTEGSADSCLWIARNSDYWECRSSVFGQGSNIFSYQWDDQLYTLTLNYSDTSENYEGVIGTVTLTVTNGAWFDMQMSVENRWQKPLLSLSFPHNLTFKKDDIDQAVVPIIFPGIMLEKNYFSLETNYIDVYPGTFHTDYLGFGIGDGRLCMYTLRKGLPVRSVKLGVQYLESGYHSAVHDYNQLWIEPGETWTSPVSRVWIGESYLNTLKSCRNDNGLDLIPSLQEKFGDRFEDFAKSPVFCYSIGESVSKPFNEIAEWALSHPSPNITMINAYYSGGFHGYHPDYLPPNPQWGTTEDFQQMVSDLKKQGKWIMPFILPNWWHEDSPTLQNLSGVTLQDIAELDIEGNPRFHSWGSNGGYFISPKHPFVISRLQKIYEDIFTTYGCDMVYEDVIGCHSAGLDFNANLATPMDLVEDWLDHFKTYSQYYRAVEGGSDRMAEYSFGFMGTVHSGSPLGPAGHVDFVLGSKIWRPYPTAPILYHDKVVPMQFWGSLYKELLSWDLLYGCQLNIWIDDGVPERASNSPWIPVMRDFQRYVVSRLTGKQMTDYSDLTDVVAQSTFEDITVIYNWDENNFYNSGEHTISPQGALVTSANGDLVAGILLRYNGENLSAGDHYLIIENQNDTLYVRQPMGADTPIKIDRPVQWTDSSKIHIYAHWDRKTGFEEIVPTIEDNHIQFNLSRIVSGDTVSYYEITYGSTSVSVEDNIAKPIKFWLYQNFPNPFNPSTAIKYSIPELSKVKLVLYNLLGEAVTTLVNEEKPAGNYEVEFNAENIPSGVYFYQLIAGDFVQTKKMILLK